MESDSQTATFAQTQASNAMKHEQLAFICNYIYTSDPVVGGVTSRGREFVRAKQFLSSRRPQSGLCFL